MMLHIDKSALLHKLEFIIKNHEIAVAETTNKLSVLKKSKSQNVQQDTGQTLLPVLFLKQLIQTDFINRVM